MTMMDEPQKLYSVVRDRGGELWMRGRKWRYWQRKTHKQQETEQGER